MMYFQNKNPKLNIGKTTGKKFVVAFDIKSYCMNENGELRAEKINAETDLLTFLVEGKSVLNAYFKKEDIKWNI